MKPGQAKQGATAASKQEALRLMGRRLAESTYVRIRTSYQGCKHAHEAVLEASYVGNGATLYKIGEGIAKGFPTCPKCGHSIANLDFSFTDAVYDDQPDAVKNLIDAGLEARAKKER